MAETARTDRTRPHETLRARTAAPAQSPPRLRCGRAHAGGAPADRHAGGASRSWHRRRCRRRPRVVGNVACAIPGCAACPAREYNLQQARPARPADSGCGTALPAPPPLPSSPARARRNGGLPNACRARRASLRARRRTARRGRVASRVWRRRAIFPARWARLKDCCGHPARRRRSPRVGRYVSARARAPGRRRAAARGAPPCCCAALAATARARPSPRSCGGGGRRRQWWPLGAGRLALGGEPACALLPSQQQQPQPQVPPQQRQRREREESIPTDTANGQRRDEGDEGRGQQQPAMRLAFLVQVARLPTPRAPRSYGGCSPLSLTAPARSLLTSTRRLEEDVRRLREVLRSPSAAALSISSASSPPPPDQGAVARLPRAVSTPQKRRGGVFARLIPRGSARSARSYC